MHGVCVFLTVVRLRDERDANARLRGETGIMRKKFTSLQNEIDVHKEDIKKLQGENGKLNNVIKNLEKDIAGLKKEIQERDETIQVYDTLYSIQYTLAEWTQLSVSITSRKVPTFSLPWATAFNIMRLRLLMISNDCQWLLMRLRLFYWDWNWISIIAMIAPLFITACFRHYMGLAFRSSRLWWDWQGGGWMVRWSGVTVRSFYFKRLFWEWKHIWIRQNYLVSRLWCQNTVNHRSIPDWFSSFGQLILKIQLENFANKKESKKKPHFNLVSKH